MLSGKKEGDYQFNALNGKTLLQGNYIDGKPNGKIVEWHENGIKKEEGKYILMKKEGEWKYWDENGELIKTEIYEGGKLIR